MQSWKVYAGFLTVMSAFLTVLTSNQKILMHFVTWFDLLRQLTVSTFNLHSVASYLRYSLESLVACTSGSSH